jgi:hypothetical protein
MHLMVDTNMARVLKCLSLPTRFATNDKGTVVSNTGLTFRCRPGQERQHLYVRVHYCARRSITARFSVSFLHPVLNGLLRPMPIGPLATVMIPTPGPGNCGELNQHLSAVAFEGPDGGFSPNGNTKSSMRPTERLPLTLICTAYSKRPNHDDTDVAWDAVGNVYYIDYYSAVWRSFSPPGTNQSTTIAPALIQLSGSPTITKVTVSGSNIVLTFSGNASDAATAYTVLSSPTVTGTYVNTSATIPMQSPGVFQASVPISGATQFYRIRR